MPGCFIMLTADYILLFNRAYDPVVGRWLSRDPLGEISELGSGPIQGWRKRSVIHGSRKGRSVMNQFWLTDEQFSKIAPHLPTDTRGKARVDDRRVISGIIHVLKLAAAGSTRRQNMDRGRRSITASCARQQRAYGSICFMRLPKRAGHLHKS